MLLGQTSGSSTYNGSFWTLYVLADKNKNTNTITLSFSLSGTSQFSELLFFGVFRSFNYHASLHKRLHIFTFVNLLTKILK